MLLSPLPPSRPAKRTQWHALLPGLICPQWLYSIPSAHKSDKRIPFLRLLPRELWRWYKISNEVQCVRIFRNSKKKCTKYIVLKLFFILFNLRHSRALSSGQSMAWLCGNYSAGHSMPPLGGVIGAVGLSISMLAYIWNWTPRVKLAKIKSESAKWLWYIQAAIR